MNIFTHITNLNNLLEAELRGTNPVEIRRLGESKFIILFGRHPQRYARGNASTLGLTIRGFYFNNY